MRHEVAGSPADAVAVEARKAADLRTSLGSGAEVEGEPDLQTGGTDTSLAPMTDAARGLEKARRERVSSLTERRLGQPAAVLAGLPTDTRPPPSVAHYDEL